jgi:beta-1,4-mannosyl-glycoprotein beta-1,4-N-acetylglucosaminyltransferase
MKIVDSFMFFDENMLLDLRLNILNKYVSKFIICEATYNHNGESKKLNFDIKNFSKFKNKIEYIILDRQPDNLRLINKNDNEKLKESKILDNALIRENFQRNYTYRKLTNLNDNDLILINDLDEIPKLENFNYKEKITIFKQRMLYFKLNLIYPGISWSGSKICKKKNFINPQWLRNIKTKKYPFWRIDTIFSKKKYSNIKIINDGGWHFTNIKTPEQIHHKMKNFLHHFEYENSGLKVDDVKKLVEEKKALYNYSVDQRQKKWTNNKQLEKINLNLLPAYIVENQNKYKEWLED